MGVTRWDSPTDRFWDKVFKSYHCWIWVGRLRNGYGVFKINSKPVAAHRFSYMVHHRATIPIDKVVMHTCDNKTCVNPYHLKLGSNQENTQDRYNKGRCAKGSRQGLSKLKEQHISMIRAMAKWTTQRRIASLFRIKQPTVNDIIRGRTWRHINAETNG